VNADLEAHSLESGSDRAWTRVPDARVCNVMGYEKEIIEEAAPDAPTPRRGQRVTVHCTGACNTRKAPWLELPATPRHAIEAVAAAGPA
jgi:hypothetical protein